MGQGTRRTQMEGKVVVRAKKEILAQNKAPSHEKTPCATERELNPTMMLKRISSIDKVTDLVFLAFAHVRLRCQNGGKVDLELKLDSNGFLLQSRKWVYFISK